MQSDANQSPCPNFPDNRENNREFCRFGPFAAIFVSNLPAKSMAYSRIPYANEQGIFGPVSGNSFVITGNFLGRTGNSHCHLVSLQIWIANENIPHATFR